MPDWDALAQIHDIQSDLARVMPNLNNCAHVKGHQDRVKPLEELKWEEKLNYLADKGATEVLDNFRRGEDRKWFPLPACEAYLYIGAKVRSSKLIEALEHHSNEIPLREYLLERNDWTTRDYGKVDWKAFRGARKQFPTEPSVFVTKLCSRWLPTAKYTAKHNNTTDRCIHCGAVETQEHVFRCPHHTRQEWRHKFIQSLSRHLDRHDTAPVLKEEMLENIDSWLSQRPPNGRWRFQQHLGHEQLLYGYMHVEWSRRQADYIRRLPEPGNKSSYTWAMKLIQFLWLQCNTGWTLRNREVHDRESTRAGHYERRNLEARLRAVHRVRLGLSAYDQQIFPSSLEEMLRKPTRDLRNWLTMNEAFVHRRHRMNAERLRSRNRSITEYFTARITRADLE